MAYEIDQDKLNGAKILDQNKPPMREKAFEKFPQLVYRHPKVAYKKTVTKDLAGNVTELTEANVHLTKLVANHEELQLALRQGWKEKPFVAPPLAVEEDPIYETDLDPEAGDPSAPTTSAPTTPVDLQSLNKAQLVEYAATLGLKLDASDTKAELLDQIYSKN